jgi:hypothetical protein
MNPGSSKKKQSKTKQNKAKNNKKQEKFRWPEHFKSLNKKNCKIFIVKQRRPLAEENNY